MSSIQTISTLSKTKLNPRNDQLGPAPHSEKPSAPPDPLPLPGQQDTTGARTNDTQGRPSSDTSPSYEETRAVAAKLQKRIDEVAVDAHKVSIRNQEETNQFVIEIQDPDGNVVKQFPPEKVLNLHQRLDDLSGMVIDEMI